MTEEVTPLGTESPAAGAPPTVTVPTVTPPQETPTPEPKTFTQAELDAIVRDRLKRTTDKYADYENLKLQSAELQKLKEGQMSEAEKMQAKLADLEKKFSDSEAAKLQLEAEVAVAKRDARAAQIATSLGAIDPHDANILAAISMISGDSDAEMKTAIENLKKAKPYLFGKPGVPLEAFNPGTATGAAETDAQRVARLRNQTGMARTPFG